MPTLPLPTIVDGLRIDAGDLPVGDTEDVLASWSGDLASVQTAPVRDAIVAGQLASQLAYQQATSDAAAQSDPLRATGEYLDEIGSYERGIKRAAGELDDAYSARVNTPPTPVDPDDIIGAVNAILAPYTDTPAFYAERPDGFFTGQPGVTSWSAHAFADTRSSLYTAKDGGANATPNYPDRQLPNRRPAGIMPMGLGDGPSSWIQGTSPTVVASMVGTAAVQPDSVVTGTGTDWTTSLQHGQFVMLSAGAAFAVVQVQTVFSDAEFAPVSAWAGGTASGLTISRVVLLPQAQCDAYGRWFHLRVPDISGIDETVGAVYQLGNPQPPENPVDGWFPGEITDGVDAATGLYPVQFDQTSTGVYQSIVDTVEGLRGHGVRWSMASDALLQP